MNNQFDVVAISLENVVDVAFVANICVDVTVAITQFGFEGLLLPFCRRLVAKEATSHVIVDADDIESLLGEVTRSFRSN